MMQLLPWSFGPDKRSAECHQSCGTAPGPGLDLARGDPCPHSSTEILGRFWGGVGKVLKPSGRAVGDVVFWLWCWMPEGTQALWHPAVARVRCPQGYRWLMALLATQYGKSRGPRRVGEPQAQPKPSQVTLPCRSIWRGFCGVPPHGGTAQPFSVWVLCTPGHNRQRCWGTDGTRQRTDGSVPDRQPLGVCGAGLVPGDSLCRPPAGDCGPRGTGTTGHRRCGHCRPGGKGTDPGSRT